MRPVKDRPPTNRDGARGNPGGDSRPSLPNYHPPGSTAGFGQTPVTGQSVPPRPGVEGQHTPRPGVHASSGSEQHTSRPSPIRHVRPAQQEFGWRWQKAPPVRHGAHSSAVPSISDPRALHTPLQHAGAEPVQRVPNGVHWGATGGLGGLAQKLPSQMPVQQSEALSVVQGCPTGLQEHLRLPFRPRIEKRWQHCLQLSLSPFLPRGFLAGHFLPLGIQASAETPSFLARTSSPNPRAASTEAVSDPPTRERLERLCASR
jgi:hypothetical protein